MPEKKSAFWAGHPLLNPKDSEKLELAAAVNEFHHGMDRDAAEKHALDEYRREHHARAAAHHLMGMRAAQASGSSDDAKKHFDMYGLHIKALGHETHQAVPAEVKRYTEGENVDRAYHFKSHGADQFLVNTVKKSEVPPSLLQYFVDLAKAGPDRFQLLDLDHGPTPEDAFRQHTPEPAPAAPVKRPLAMNTPAGQVPVPERIEQMAVPGQPDEHFGKWDEEVAGYDWQPPEQRPSRWVNPVYRMLRRNRHGVPQGSGAPPDAITAVEPHEHGLRAHFAGGGLQNVPTGWGDGRHNYDEYLAMAGARPHGTPRPAGAPEPVLPGRRRETAAQRESRLGAFEQDEARGKKVKK